MTAHFARMSTLRHAAIVLLAACCLLTHRVRAVAADPDPTLDRAIRLFETGRFPEAKGAFETVWRADTRSAVAAYYLGRLGMRDEALDESIDWFEKAVAIDDRNSTYHLWLGRAFGLKAMNSNVFQQASLAGKVRSEFERAVELDPSNLDARFDLLTFYIRAPRIMGGGIEKALAQAEEIRQRDAAKGHLAMARIHDHEKKTDLAEQDLLDAVKVKPGDPEPRLQLGYLYQRLERYDEAFRVFEEMAGTEDGRMAGLYQIGRTGVLSGRNLDRAAECLSQYLREAPVERLPTPASAHFRLGQVYEKQGKIESAREQYQATLRLSPDHKEAQQAMKALPSVTTGATSGR